MRLSDIVGFEPIHPDRVQVVRQDGRNYYLVQTDEGTIETIDQDDMLHFPGIGFDGKRSLTPIRAALRTPAGIALAADEFAGAFFKNGARPDFALRTEKDMEPYLREPLSKGWKTVYGIPRIGQGTEV